MSRKLTLRSKDPDTLVLSGLDEFLSAILRDVPSLGTPSAGSERRLFPDPTGGRESQTDADWRELVRPELEEHFALNRDVVRDDLEKMRSARGGVFELEIAVAHLPQWIHALNQARLALDAQHQIGDRQIDEESELSGEDGLVLFQIQFYGLLQEWMLSRVDSL
jgi:hypothetical protein